MLGRVAVILIIVIVGLYGIRYIINPSYVEAQPAMIPGPKYSASENFQEQGTDLPIGGGDSPALNEMRTPYVLLKDALPPLMLGKKHTLVNSQTCYDRDYKAQDSLTGNYSKRTNNYLPTYPDTCTGPRQEFIFGFYDQLPGVPNPRI
jgi:hypothetical protein